MAFIARDLTAEFLDAGLGDKYGPDLVVGIFDSGTFHGGFVGDNTSLCSGEKIWNGGIRDVSDPGWLSKHPLTMLELLFCFLARPMTLKHFWCYLKNQVPEFGLWGGGKGMMVRDGFSGTREDFIIEWTKAMSEFTLPDGRKLLGEAFIGGADAGLNESDLALICQTNGSLRCVTGGPGYYQYEKEGITGRILLHAAKLLAEYQGLSWGELCLAIYGFGNVGQGVAKWLLEDQYRGPKLIAVSNRKFANEQGVANHEGLNPAKVLSAVRMSGRGLNEVLVKSGRGDGVFPYEPGEEINLFDLDALFLAVPQVNVINDPNAWRVKSKLVLSGTNGGITAEAHKILYKRGILAPPDFVVNMGAASTAKSSWHGLSEERCVELAISAITRNLLWLVSESESRGETMAKIAEEEVFRSLTPRRH